MSSLKSFITKLKLDLTNAVVIHDGGDGYQPVNFDIQAKDYLRFAKEDLEENNLKGFINALSNAKRAIDCQIDELFQIFDLECSEKEGRDFFLDHFQFKPDLPMRLKMIQALNFSPSYLISKVRNIRNKVEHEYKKPEIENVKQAVEIADLFIRSVFGKIWVFESHLVITDDSKLQNIKEHHSFSKECIQTRFNHDNKSFEVNLRSETIIEPIQSIEIKSDKKEFYSLLRMANSADDEFELIKSFKILIDSIDHDIPNEKIKCKLI